MSSGLKDEIYNEKGRQWEPLSLDSFIYLTYYFCRYIIIMILEA